MFDALAGYTDAHKFSITPFYVDMCRRLKIMGYIPDTAYRWFDIGSPEKPGASRGGNHRLTTINAGMCQKIGASFF